MTATEVPWDQFITRWPSQYLQDQHVTVIGPTDCGKTTLSKRLIECRGHVVGFGVKYKDESMSDLLHKGWHRAERWKDKPRTADRVLLWPKANDPDEAAALHRKRFTEALHAIYKTGKWCIWTDELRYLCDNCGMKRTYANMYVTARSNKISLVSASQRPAWVPLEAFSSASHLFLYRTGDEKDLERMGNLNGVSARQVARTVGELPFHSFLHVNTRTGEQTISSVQL